MRGGARRNFARPLRLACLDLCRTGITQHNGVTQDNRAVSRPALRYDRVGPALQREDGIVMDGKRGGWWYRSER